MAFTQVAQLTGDTDTYEISPQIKKYALMDTGFIQQTNGSFQLLRQLETAKSFEDSFKLKVVVNADLTGFKIKVVNAKGTAVINIFNHQNAAALKEQFGYFVDELITRDILIRK